MKAARGGAAVLLLLLCLSVALAMAELVKRVAPRPHRSSGRFVGDPVLHHRMRSNWSGLEWGHLVRTNSLGLRDREHGEKAPGTVRVLMLGDSFIEGLGLRDEDVIPRQVVRRLRRLACRRIEVVNAGVTSYSPILEYLLLQHVGLRLAPDLVVLNFDMTDVHDDVIRAGIARLGPDGLPLAVPATREEAALLLPPLPLPRPLGFLAPAERLATRLVIYRDFRKSRLGQRLLGPLKLTPERLASLGLIGNVQYDILAITRDGQFPGMREAWALTERHVRGIRDLAAAHDIPFVLTVYPHAHQVSATESPAGRGHVGIGPGLYSSEAPFQILERLGRREGFPVISLLRAFRAAEASEAPLFRTDDIHHTPAGTRVFAEAFVQRLLAEPALGRLLGGCGGPERQERTKGQAKRRRKLVESRSRRACLSPSGPRPSRR